MDIIVLSPADWRLWRELRLSALAEAPAAFGSTLADWTGAGDTEKRWCARLSSVAVNMVVTWKGRPAGMISATAPAAPSAPVELISMWVAPLARGHGIGDAAMRAALDWARLHHPDSPVVLSVKAGNDPAVRLYERHGFTDAGIAPDDPDERLMRHTAVRHP